VLYTATVCYSGLHLGISFCAWYVIPVLGVHQFWLHCQWVTLHSESIAQRSTLSNLPHIIRALALGPTNLSRRPLALFKFWASEQVREPRERWINDIQIHTGMPSIRQFDGCSTLTWHQPLLLTPCLCHICHVSHSFLTINFFYMQTMTRLAPNFFRSVLAHLDG
jgi:hypothetical protein